MVTTITEELNATKNLPIVDCDLHVIPEEEGVTARLPDRFRTKGVSYPNGNWPSPINQADGGLVPGLTPAGADPERIVEEYLDPLGIDRAVVVGGGPNVRAAAQPDSRYAAALASAYNDWLVDEWLKTDDRFYGSISIAPQAPEEAVKEIRRWGNHPKMVQVITGGATRVALGNRRYWPIYEAATEADLPVAIHAGGEGYGIGHPNTGAGYPSTAVEQHSVVPANFMGQLLNLLLDGPFVEFPDLRIVLIGSGYSWVPPYLWRIDKVWKGLSDQYPWVEQPPSKYVRERVRLVTYPIDEAGDLEHTERMLKMVDAENTLLFGSNYPRRDGYAPGDRLPELSASLARSIFSETATDLYGM